MERLNLHINLGELNEWLEKLNSEEPPEGCVNRSGFELLSIDKTYQLELWLSPDGELEICVREPRGSYEALEKLSYSEIAESTEI